MITVKGSCHCQNIQLRLLLTMSPDFYSPRLCDCDFCTRHGAAYISDPKGRLEFMIDNPSSLQKERQGSNTAEFLSCLNCALLVAVRYEDQGKTFAAVNLGAIDKNTIFGPKIKVSPKTLSKNEKTTRWKDVWFSDVRLTFESERI